jgi:hypothetical protein
MKLYNTIKPYIVTTCVSFTVVSLLQVFLFDQTIIEVNKYLPIHIFFVCVCVNIMIFITDHISFKNEITKIIVSVSDVIVVALLMNYIIYQVFYNPLEVLFSWQEIGISVLALIATYFIVVMIASVKNKADIDKINKELRLRHKKNNNATRSSQDAKSNRW